VTDLQEWKDIFKKYGIDHTTVYDNKDTFLETNSSPILSILFDKKEKFIDYGVFRNHDI
jgi:hypothetical protein